MKDIRELYENAKNGHSRSSALALYTETIDDFANSKPNEYFSNLRYIITSSYGLGTLKRFMEKHSIPLPGIPILEDCINECIRSRRHRGMDTSAYTEALDYVKEYKNKYKNCYSMYENYSNCLDDKYISAYYANFPKLKTGGSVNIVPLLERYGMGCVPDLMVYTNGDKSIMEDIFQQELDREYRFRRNLDAQWVVDSYKDLDVSDEGDDILDIFTKESAEYIVNKKRKENQSLYVEAMVDGNENEGCYEYTEYELSAYENLISYKEFRIVGEEDEEKRSKLWKEVYSLYDELADMVTDNLPMTPFVEKTMNMPKESHYVGINTANGHLMNIVCEIDLNNGKKIGKNRWLSRGKVLRIMDIDNDAAFNGRSVTTIDTTSFIKLSQQAYAAMKKSNDKNIDKIDIEGESLFNSSDASFGLARRIVLMNAIRRVVPGMMKESSMRHTIGAVEPHATMKWSTRPSIRMAFKSGMSKEVLRSKADLILPRNKGSLPSFTRLRTPGTKSASSSNASKTESVADSVIPMLPRASMESGKLLRNGGMTKQDMDELIKEAVEHKPKMDKHQLIGGEWFLQHIMRDNKHTKLEPLLIMDPEKMSIMGINDYKPDDLYTNYDPNKITQQTDEERLKTFNTVMEKIKDKVGNAKIINIPKGSKIFQTFPLMNHLTAICLIMTKEMTERFEKEGMTDQLAIDFGNANKHSIANKVYPEVGSRGYGILVNLHNTIPSCGTNSWSMEKKIEIALLHELGHYHTLGTVTSNDLVQYDYHRDMLEKLGTYITQIDPSLSYTEVRALKSAMYHLIPIEDKANKHNKLDLKTMTEFSSGNPYPKMIDQYFNIEGWYKICDIKRSDYNSQYEFILKIFEFFRDKFCKAEFVNKNPKMFADILDAVERENGGPKADKAMTEGILFGSTTNKKTGSVPGYLKTAHDMDYGETDDDVTNGKSNYLDDDDDIDAYRRTPSLPSFDDDLARIGSAAYTDGSMANYSHPSSSSSSNNNQPSQQYHDRDDGRRYVKNYYNYNYNYSNSNNTTSTNNNSFNNSQNAKNHGVSGSRQPYPPQYHRPDNDYSQSDDNYDDYDDMDDVSEDNEDADMNAKDAQQKDNGYGMVESALILNLPTPILNFSESIDVNNVSAGEYKKNTREQLGEKAKHDLDIFYKYTSTISTTGLLKWVHFCNSSNEAIINISDGHRVEFVRNVIDMKDHLLLMRSEDEVDNGTVFIYFHKGKKIVCVSNPVRMLSNKPKTEASLGSTAYAISGSIFDFLDSGYKIDGFQKEKMFDKIMAYKEDVGDLPENDLGDLAPPESDDKIRDTMLAVDQKLNSVGANIKQKFRTVHATGKAIMKPFQRIYRWIDETIENWKDKNENEIKREMTDPQSRSRLFGAIKSAFKYGSLFKAGLLLNPVFLFLYITRKYDKSSDMARIRNELIGELKTELRIIEDKIQTADRKEDHNNKYKLMRIKNEINKKLIRVGGTPEMRKII